MSDVIKLHNHLGQARYRMSLTEQKLFIYAVRHIDQSSTDFAEVEFRISDFAADAGLHPKTLYREIENITENIMKTVIKRDRDDQKKGFTMYNLTRRCEYIEGEGLIKFCFNDDMRPLLLQLQSHYFLQNPEVIAFRSWYAIRLYDILKSESYKDKPIQMDLENMKKILGVSEKYPRFNNLKQFVIDPAVNEINEKSEMKILWEKITQGKKVLGLQFQLQFPEKRDGIVTLHDTSEKKTAAWTLDGKFESDEILELRRIASIKAAGRMDPEEYVHRNFVYTTGQEGVKKPYEYLKKALELDYANALNQITMFDEPTGTGTSDGPRRGREKKNRFHNFEGKLSQMTAEELEALINKRKRGASQ